MVIIKSKLPIITDLNWRESLHKITINFASIKIDNNMDIERFYRATFYG